MYVLLPKAEGAAALKNFQDQLTAETIEYLISNMKNETCVIGFPRMKLSSKLNLNNALLSLGLHSMFDPKTADLSLLSSGIGQPPIPQVPVVSSPQTQATPIPQAQAAASIPQPLPTSIPQTQIPRQISPSQLPNTNIDQLIFTRNSFEIDQGTKRNYFTYDDKKRGINVEQWDMGFNIRKIGRTRREAENGRQRNDMKSSRATYVTENDDLEKIASKVGDANTRYVGLEENKYRFRNAEKNTKSRRRRQSRPIDENFLRFMQNSEFPFL